MAPDIDRYLLCTKELEFLQFLISKYDSNGLTIKSWCLAAVSAVGAYSVVHHSVFIASITAIATLGFASIELIYRCIQFRFITRSKEIEALLQIESLLDYRYRLSTAATTIHWGKEMRTALRQPQFTLFYTTILALAVLLVLGLVNCWIPCVK